MKRAIGPAAVGATGVAMLAWTWGTWPDVLVDFGRELYIPWQLSEGRRLYVDIIYFNGPLSPYLNALWFRLFGVSLRTLVLANIALLSVLVVLLYRLLIDASGRLAATAACITFMTIFGFGQLVWIGNYNFICPYSHDLTHGMILSVAAIFFLFRYQRSRRLAWLAGAGVTLGLTFLTKPEVFLAAAAATSAGLGLTIRMERPRPSRGVGMVVAFAAAGALPPVVALAALGLVMPAREAWVATAGAWPWILRSEVASTVFYETSMGTLAPGRRLEIMLMGAGWYAAVLGSAAALALVAGKPSRWRLALAGLSTVAGLDLLAWRWLPMSRLDAGRPLPLAMLVLGLCVLVALARGGRATGARLVPKLTLVVFAFVLLWKIILNARLYHYGFALAVPATVLMVVALVDWGPAALTALGGHGGLARVLGLGIVLAAIVVHLHIVRGWLVGKTHAVASGPDAFLADARGPFVTRALEEIGRRIPEGGTLTVFPEGAMLNYLARRRDSTRYLSYMPPVLLMLGEDNVLASLEATPPDYIALVHKDTSEYGVRFFGRDYAQRIAVWIEQRYQPVALIGAPPLRDDRFGIMLLERREAG